MNTTLKEQIEAIQVAMNSLQKINDGVFLLSVNHELVSKVLPALNDAGSSLAALHMSDPYKEIERLQAKLKEANDIISHYADVNQNQ